MGLLFGDLVWTPFVNILNHILFAKSPNSPLFKHTQLSCMHNKEKNPLFSTHPKLQLSSPFLPSSSAPLLCSELEREDGGPPPSFSLVPKIPRRRSVLSLSLLSSPPSSPKKESRMGDGKGRAQDVTSPEFPDVFNFFP